MAPFVLLFLLFGSVLVPIKALVLNVLSLTATFGAMVWIFQDGHLAGLLGFTADRHIDTTTPILMFCIAFGLSMDYEVFLLSRIKEEHDRTGDNDQSVAVGLERTGRIVTAAAAAARRSTFLAFATSRRQRSSRCSASASALAVLMDATSSAARSCRRSCGWPARPTGGRPAPLRRLHERFGLHEAGPADPERTGPQGPPSPSNVSEAASAQTASPTGRKAPRWRATAVSAASAIPRSRRPRRGRTSRSSTRRRRSAVARTVAMRGTDCRQPISALNDEPAFV